MERLGRTSSGELTTSTSGRRAYGASFHGLAAMCRQLKHDGKGALAKMGDLRDGALERQGYEGALSVTIQGTRFRR